MDAVTPQGWRDGDEEELVWCLMCYREQNIKQGLPLKSIEQSKMQQRDARGEQARINRKDSTCSHPGRNMPSVIQYSARTWQILNILRMS